MKPLTAMLCLFALLCHVAVASVGAVNLCIEKGSNGELSFGCAQEAPDPCCPPENADGARTHDEECEACFEGRIDTSNRDDATSSADRIPVKAPIATARLPILVANLVLTEQHQAIAYPRNRSPLGRESGALEHFAKTVSFRL